MNPLTINPNWKNKTEEEQTPLTITWGKNNTFSQPLFPETPPAPEIIPAPEIVPAPETPAPTFTASVLDIMGLGSAPLDAEQGRALMQTGQELMQKNQPNDWTGRQELIDEYRKLQQSIQADDNAVAMGAMQPADYMDRANRMNALRQQLEQGDIAAGNGPMAYSGQDRIANVLGGAGKNIASGITSAAGTAGEVAGRAQRMEEEQNREQLFAPADALGFNTDRAKEAARQVSEAETANAHEKWETVQSAADRMGESATQELQRAKNGLSKLGQAGVDISENIIEMGFDAAVAAATGGSSLIPMFARTFGSAASEARKDGASLDEQVLYGTTKGGIEVLTEKMFDGLAGVYGKGAADDITEKLIGKLAKSKEGATMLRVLFNGGGEMLEEFVSSIFDPMARAIYQDIDISPNLSAFGLGDQPLSAEDARALMEAGKKPGYFSNVDVADMLYSGLIGFAIGAMGGGASIATGQNARANAELGFGTAPVEAAPEVAPAAPAVEAAPEADTPEVGATAPAAETDRGEIIDKLESLTRYADQLRIKGDTANEAAVREQIAELNQQLQETLAPAAPVETTYVNRATATAQSNPLAQAILSNPDLRTAFEQQTGIQLSGENAETALAEFFNRRVDNPGTAVYTNNEGVDLNGAGGAESQGGTVQGVRELVQEYDRGNARGGENVQGDSPDVRRLRALNDTQRQTLQERGIVFFDTEDVSENKAAFSAALEEGKASQKFGPFVDSKSVEDLANTRTYLAPNGAGGFAVRNDGDIEAVFTKRGVAPKDSSAGLVIGAVAQGGTKLDCYGIVLVNTYGRGGFVPVAQVDWNQNYAPPGWTPELGTPQVYVMMHNGDSADTVAQNFGNYPYWSQADLDALPRFTGDSGYDNALAYRDMLLAQQQNNQSGPPNGGTTAQETAPADEAGFSMPENEGAAGETGTPAGATSRTTESGPVSQTAETVRTSPDTNAETRAAIEEATEAGGFNYLPISNDETVRKARERINRDGFEATLAKWERAIVQGRTSADLIATGRLLYNDAQAQGNTQMALQVLSDLQAATTNAAQALQIQRLFQSFNPQTRYNMLQRQIDNLSDKYQRQLPDGVKISDELKSEYINAESEEARDAALDKIRDSIAQQLPSTWRDKIRALRYLNMLGNFRTQGRNIIGNTAMSAVTSAKNAVQFGLERIAYGLSGGKTELTTSAFVDPAMIAAAKADYRENADAINGEAKYSDRAETGLAREAEEAKRIFKSRIMEGYRKLTNWAMTRGDTVFIGNRYARTFGGYLKANGMDAATLTGIQNGTIEPTKTQTELIDKARAYAAREAQEATFHDDNVLSNWISRLGRKETTPKFARMLAEGIMPFRKTPANVLVRAEEYSPMGLLNTAYKAAQAARGEGDVTSSDVINQLSKSLTGTGLFLLGMALRNSGHLTGHEDDDKQREFNALRGDQEYALVFDDGTSFTLDWVAPASMPLFMGAQMMDIVADGDVSLDDLSDVFASLADPMIEMSMLQGLNDALDNLKYSDNNLGTIAANAALSYLTQIMSNTLLGQAERSFEDKRYSTFVNGDSKVGKMVERNLGKLSAKTPGWDRNQVEYIDAWGRTQDTGLPLARAATNFLSPGYVGKDRSTEVDDELQRLYDAGQNNVFPQRIPMSEKVTTYDRDGNRTGERALTADEYVTFQKEMGQKSLELVKDLMDSKIYDKLTDDAKAEAISEIYKYAKNQAALKVEKSTKDENADVTGLSNIAGYYAVRAAFSKAAGNAKNRDYKALDKMLDEYKAMPKDVRALIDDKNSTIGKLSEAKDAGIDSQGYFKVIDNVKAITPVKGHDKPIKWQKIDYVGSAKLSDKQKDYFMDYYLEDAGLKAKYKACREAGFKPEDIAAFYRIFNTTKGDDKNNDGRSDKNTRKANIIKAAMEYRFNKEQATGLYNMWQKGSWK